MSIEALFLFCIFFFTGDFYWGSSFFKLKGYVAITYILLVLHYNHFGKVFLVFLDLLKNIALTVLFKQVSKFDIHKKKNKM